MSSLPALGQRIPPSSLVHSTVLKVISASSDVPAASSVVIVPSAAAVRLYLQLPTVVLVITNVTDRVSLVHELPRIVAVSLLSTLMHHGTPLPILVSMVKLPKLPVHSPFGPVPVHG